MRRSESGGWLTFPYVSIRVIIVGSYQPLGVGGQSGGVDHDAREEVSAVFSFFSFFFFIVCFFFLHVGAGLGGAVSSAAVSSAAVSSARAAAWAHSPRPAQPRGGCVQVLLAGGIDAVVVAMQMHPHLTDLQVSHSGL
jgi:hypothetical protein